MAQDKKEKERNYLNSFLSTKIGIQWLNQNKIDRYSQQDTEQPDFLFKTFDDEIIGLEITRFIAKTYHGIALQHLMSIGNKVCQYSKKHHNLNISILIDKYDRRKFEARTYKELMEACYNPGFMEKFDADLMKSAIEKIVDNNVEKLKSWPSLVKETIEVQNEYFQISVSGFPNLKGNYECDVNNESRCVENPVEDIQKEIDKKNKKYKAYREKCSKCFLLVYVPDSSEGNYCWLTKEIKNYHFNIGLDGVFLYDSHYKWDDESIDAIELLS